jgi:general L-amino acid transport system permease protein
VTTTQTPPTSTHKPPFWRDVRIIRVALQVGFLVAVAALLLWLFDNLMVNLRGLGIRQDFGFLDQPGGFRVPGSDIAAQSPIRDLLRVGFVNIIRVAVPGIVIAIVLGVIVGVSRLSTNWLVRRTASIYVEVLRNVPPLVLLVFFYFAVLQGLPGVDDSIVMGRLGVFNNRGLYLPSPQLDGNVTLFLVAILVSIIIAVVVGKLRTKRFDETGRPHHRVAIGLGVVVVVVGLAWLLLDRPLTFELPVLDQRIVTGGWRTTNEYSAVLIALALYTSAFIAEIVRGSIQAVHRGQTEASAALGLSGLQRLRFIILPQALRIATPSMGNEFLNLTKNVSLGVFVAFPELLRIGRQAVGNGAPAPQTLAIVLLGYLTLSLSLSVITNLANRRLQLVER